MTDRRITRSRPKTADQDEAGTPPLRHQAAPASSMTGRLSRPHSREEAEARYVAARDEWTAAMKACSSGRPSDMAALAIAQEAYEAALAERERWANSPSVPIPVEADRPRGIDVVVGQELSWRRVHEHEQARDGAGKARKGVLGRLFGR
jgi:hypothetical protein